VSRAPSEISGLLVDGWAASPPLRVRIEYEADDPTIAAFRAAIAAFEAAGPGDADREELVRLVAARLRPAIQEAASFMLARAATLADGSRRRNRYARTVATKAAKRAAAKGA